MKSTKHFRPHGWFVVLSTLRLSAILCIALSTIALLAGCGFTASKQAGEKLIANHFQAIGTHGYTAALTNYGAQFFAKTSPAEWASALEKVGSKLGQFQNYTIVNWNVHKGVSTTGSGTTVKMTVNSTYRKQPAQEQFILFKGSNDPEFKILGHHINSIGLLKE